LTIMSMLESSTIARVRKPMASSGRSARLGDGTGEALTTRVYLSAGVRQGRGMTLSDFPLAIAGSAAAVVAVVAWVADRRRAARVDLDRVGFMPWTGVFFLSLMAAVLLLGIAAKVEFGA
jgi:hypothetical protein